MFYTCITCLSGLYGKYWTWARGQTFPYSPDSLVYRHVITDLQPGYEQFGGLKVVLQKSDAFWACESEKVIAAWLTRRSSQLFQRFFALVFSVSVRIAGSMKRGRNVLVSSPRLSHITMNFCGLIFIVQLDKLPNRAPGNALFLGQEFPTFCVSPLFGLRSSASNFRDWSVDARILDTAWCWFSDGLSYTLLSSTREKREHEHERFAAGDVQFYISVLKRVWFSMTFELVFF